MVCTGLSLLAVLFFGCKSVQACIYNSDTDVTYKEYWVPHTQFTGGIVEEPLPPLTTRDCVADAPTGNSFFLEPGVFNRDKPQEYFCDKTVTFEIPDDMSAALKAELYFDLWRNHAPTYNNQGKLIAKASATFRINDNLTWFESHPRGADWSRTPLVTEELYTTDANGNIVPSSRTAVLGLLKKGQNTITFRNTGGQYHLHDLAVRIYFDDAHPLRDPAGQPIQAPNGQLKTVWHDGGVIDAATGGNLLVDDDQLVLSADVTTPADFVEFHAFYRGYDEDNDDADTDGSALDTDWHNAGRNNFHPGGTEADVLGGTINHVGTVSAPHPGNYSIYWDISHILSQPGVKFKIRIVDEQHVVREAAGGVSAPFTLTRSRSMVSASAMNWVDIGLYMSNTITPARPATVTRVVNLCGGQTPANYDEAYLVGAY